METKTIILIIISLLVLLLPFVFAYFNSKRKDNKTKSVLKKYADEYNFRLDESNTLSNFAIGLDIEQGILIFIKLDNNQASAEIVNLYDIKSVRLIKEKRSVKAGKSSTLIIEKVSIALTNKKADSKEIYLELYDENVNLTLNGEIQVAEKWVCILEKAVK